MMEEEAVVTTVEGGQVWVEKARQSACSSCAEKCASGLTDGLFGKRSIRFSVISQEKLIPGDKVVIGLPEGAILQGAFGIYLIPLVALFGGALFGKFIAEQSGTMAADVGSAVGGLAALFVCLISLKLSKAFDKSALRPVFLRKVR